MQKAKINYNANNGFNTSPLFFLKKESNEIWDATLRHSVQKEEWISTNPRITYTVPYSQFPFDQNYIMMAPDDIELYNRLIHKKIQPDHEATFNVHPVSSSLISDTTLIFNQVNMRHTETQNIYQVSELLWFLNHNKVNIDILDKSLSQYDAPTKSLLIDYIKKCSVCLSYPKQKAIKQLLDKYIVYNIYYPDFIIEAINESLPGISYTSIEYNLFKVIFMLLGYTRSNKYQIRDVPSSNNPLLKLKKWLDDDTCSYTDFTFIEKIINFMTPNLQFLVIKRYFRSVLLGHYAYDPGFLSRLGNNKFHRFQTYLHSIYMPSAPTDLTVPVLVDSINTYIGSKGKRFQKIDGILDQFIRNSDPLYVNVDFGLNKILPVCNGGAVYNSKDFKGFIDYSITFSIRSFKDINEQKQAVYSLLDHLFQRVCLTSCESNFKNKLRYCMECTSRTSSCNSNIISSYCSGCSLHETQYFDKWFVPHAHKDRNILKHFLRKGVILPEHDITLSINMINLFDFNDNLSSYLSTIASQSDKTFVIGHLGFRNLNKYIRELITFRTIRFRLREDVYFGSNILNLGRNTNPLFEQKDTQLIAEEKQQVKKIISSTLEKELGTRFDSSGQIEIQFDEKKLDKILKRYYFSYKTEKKNEDIPFLIPQKIKYEKFCAPEYEDKYNDATNLPYFWCNGKECFKNSLQEQTLATVTSWKKYTLFHILEILGYPQITETPAGLQPQPIIRAFIALINRARHIVSRISCRECGHLMYPVGKSNFNRYNYFACFNPSCKEYEVSVYLNYCNNCKKGLIDSRDNAQCPNHWYICPSCLGCCNDEVIERQVQKYMVSHRPIPTRLVEIRGKGHNDKLIFYCPSCGEKLQEKTIMLHDEEERDILFCQKCKYSR